MNANEIVGALRQAANAKTEVSLTAVIMYYAADLIESMQAELTAEKRRTDVAVGEIVRIITNESRCDLCGRLLGNGDCEIYSDKEERCDPIPRYERRGVDGKGGNDG